MKLTYFTLLLGVLLAACSVVEPVPDAISSDESIPEPGATAAVALPASTETMPASTLTLSASENPASPLDLVVTTLGLSGKLLFTQGTNGLWQVDLDAATLRQLLVLPEGGHMGGVAASPAGSQMVLAYGPPPEAGPQLFLTDLYLIQIGKSELTPLLVRTTQVETFANPVWSPDGEWLYYSHLKQLEDGSGVSLNIERIAIMAGGEPEIVVENAHQPALSLDMTQLAFLHFDQAAQTNALWIAGIDGSETKELLLGTAFPDIAAPRFAGNGKTIIFGASGEQEAARPSFWDRMLGVRAAYAHGAPWALLSIAASGGSPIPLTETVFDGTWPTWSPDGEQLAFLEAAGIYLVTDDGLKRLAESTREGEMVWTR